MLRELCNHLINPSLPIGPIALQTARQQTAVEQAISRPLRWQRVLCSGDRVHLVSRRFECPAPAGRLGQYILGMARSASSASHAAAVGTPVWSATTFSWSRSAAKRSMVFKKFCPWAATTQELLKITYRAPLA